MRPRNMKGQYIKSSPSPFDSQTQRKEYDQWRRTFEKTKKRDLLRSNIFQKTKSMLKHTVLAARRKREIEQLNLELKKILGV